jgi:signal transduction histidine kinase/CheY-like chemotaxis protein
MRLPHVMKHFPHRFSARIFLTFTVLIVGISLVFTVFFFRYQSRSLTESTVGKGEILTDLFAQNVILGTFSENHELLDAPIAGMLENKEVVSVAVCTVDGKLLEERDRSGKGSADQRMRLNADTMEALKQSSRSIYSSSNGNFVFCKRVAMKSKLARNDSVYFDPAALKEQEQVVGFVRVVTDSSLLRDRLHALLFHSILIGIVFFLLGSVAAYLFAGMITKPLKRLTEGVEAFGRGSTYEPISVETTDEIGDLATAFNGMIDSLKKRDAEKGELEEQLRHSQKMEAIGTLAGGIAHDFNNILTAIIGYSTLLKHGISDKGRHRAYAEQIIDSSERAATLTHRLLAFSRKQLINPRPVDLNDTIRGIEGMLCRLIDEDIELRFVLDATAPVVLADSVQMDQVLINLVTNARDAMPEGGMITISTAIATRNEGYGRQHDHSLPGDYAIITVSDSGVGMAEEIKARIFDPFFTTKEVGKGTGLGLSMVYGIVKQHEGIVEVVSEPGKGTSFSIYLPLDRQALEKREVAAPVLVRGGAETILVAEDDAAVRELLKEVLETNGYDVIEARNGEDAIDKFIAFNMKIRLVLIDIVMPKKNGMEVFEEIKRIRPDIKVLFLSGYTREVLGRKGMLEEGFQVITKPVQPGDFLVRLRAMLDG